MLGIKNRVQIRIQRNIKNLEDFNSINRIRTRFIFLYGSYIFSCSGFGFLTVQIHAPVFWRVKSGTGFCGEPDPYPGNEKPDPEFWSVLCRAANRAPLLNLMYIITRSVAHPGLLIKKRSESLFKQTSINYSSKCSSRDC